MSAELAARRTAAAAVAADFKRETDGYLDAGGPRPDFDLWAWRLHTELGLVLDHLDAETPDPAAGQLAQIRLVLDMVLGDEYADRQYALEQIDHIMRSGR